MKGKIQYTRELLDKCLQTDNAVLVDNYDKINSTIKLNFICSCGSHDSKLFRYIVNDGGAYCKNCAIKNAKSKRIVTNQNLFGTDSPLQNKDILEKLKETNRSKYGTDFVLSSKLVVEKRRKTNADKTVSEKEKTSEKMKNVFKQKTQEERDAILEKRKKTNLKKYGVTTTLLDPVTKHKITQTLKTRYGVDTNISQSKEIQAKIKQKCKETYNVVNHQSRPDVKEKTRNTNIQKYGAIAPTCSPEIRNKVKQTNIIRYGTENPLQNMNVFEKVSITSKRYKDYMFPSGHIGRIQGYENIALDELLLTFDEAQIVIGRKNIPAIWYQDNSVKRRYFPDIFIPHMNLLIEVKSTWTYNCKKDNVDLKAKCCIDQGYNYQIWIYDTRKQKTIIDSF